MRPIRLLVIAAVAVTTMACGPKGVEKPAPLPEWLCTGRTTTSSVRVRIEASTREEALDKLKQQYPDIGAPSCTPNPRR
jgi:hypothetical protein